jgi:uncharacterized repeat protein (TIGR01451 family)
MKKSLNISLFLLVFVLSSSLSCESWPGFKKSSDPNQIKGIPTGGNEEYRSEAQIGMTDSYSDEEMSVSVRPELINVTEVGSSVVSRTYPWAECGIVQLDKSMPKEVGLNTQFNYTITIINLTDTKLDGIIIKETKPSHFKLVSANPVAEEDTNKLTWEIETLGPKATRQITVSGIATSAEPLRHCTTVLTPVIPACASVEVIQPRLKLMKMVPSEVLLCDLVPVKYVVSNVGTGSIPNVRIVDTLPSGLRTTDGRSELVFDAGVLMAGQSKEFSIDLRAARVGEYFSRAVATSTTGLRDESEETLTKVGLPVLAISKSGAEQLYIGRPVTYEITVSNRSDVPARDTMVEDTIPEGVASVKATAGAELSGLKLIWNLGTLEPGSSETFQVSYTPTTTGTIVSDATATANCATPITASMKTTVTGIPAIMLEVVDVEDPVRIGNRATYTITVTNQGSATSRNIRINCILEDNVKYVSSAGATSSSIQGDTVRFLPLGSLAPQDKAVWRVVVAAVRPGDVRFKVVMNSDELTRSVEESEATHLYE